VHATGGGEPHGALRLDLAEMVNRLGQLEDTVLASAARARRRAPEEEPLRHVGEQLFRALFAGAVGGAYRASLAVARERGTRLRVVLRLTAPELAVLPWEALWDPEVEGYVCRREPLMRHVPAPYTPEPLPVNPPLRILGLTAAPRGLPALDEYTERRRLEAALTRSLDTSQIMIDWLAQATFESVHDRLLTGQWHVLHFIGHGTYDATTDEGQVAFVGDDDRADWVRQAVSLTYSARPTQHRDWSC
jgi:hypothetical protein